jgi:hypothetical protein
MTFWYGSRSKSVRLTCVSRSSSSPALFVRTFKMLTKQNMFLLLTFRRYIYIILQRYKLKKKSNNSTNQILLCLFNDRKIWIWEAQKLTDPNPEH